MADSVVEGSNSAFKLDDRESLVAADAAMVEGTVGW